MRHIIFLALLLITLAPAAAQSAANDSLFAQGKGLYEAGKYAEAIPVFERVAQMDREEAPEDADLEGITRQWLASCYFKLGDIEHARKESEFFYDQEPIDRALTKQSRYYATLVNKATDIDNAIFWAKQVLEEEQKALGEDNYFVQGSYCNVASLYSMKGDSINARMYLNKAKDAAEHTQSREQGWRAPLLTLESGLEFAGGNTKGGKQLAADAVDLLDGHMSKFSMYYHSVLQLLLNQYLAEADVESGNAFAERAAQEYMALDPANVDVENLYAIPSLLVSYYTLSGQPALGKPIADRAIGLASANSEPLAELLYARGVLNKLSMNLEEAVDDIQNAIKIYRMRYPRDYSFLGPHYFALGECYDLQHDYAAFEEALRTAGQLFRKQGAYGLPGQVQTLHHLGALATRTGEYKKALGYLDDCLKLMDRNNAGSVSDRAYLLKERGNCENGLGNRDQALDNYRRAMDMYETNDLPLTDETYFLAATQVCTMLSSDESTRHEADSILAKLKSLYPDSSLFHRRMRITLQNFEANYLKNSGLYEDALGVINQAIAEVQNVEYQDEATLYNTKFIILIGLERKDEALELIDGYSDAIEKRYGTVSRQYAQALGMQAVLMKRLGEVSDVNLLNSVGDKIIDISQRVYSDADGELASLLMLGAGAKAVTHPHEAGEILKKLLSKSKNLSSSQKFTIYGTLADVERVTGNHSKAIEYAEKMLEEAEANPFNDHYTTLSMYVIAGTTYLAAGRLADAEDMLTRAYEMARSGGSTENMNVLVACQHLANLYNKMGKMDRAREFFERVNKLSQENYAGNSMIFYSNLVNGLWVKYAAGQKEECLTDIDAIERTLSELEQAPNVDTSLPRRLRAMYYLYEKDFDAAHTFASAALTESRNFDNLSLCAQIAFEQEDFARAEKLTKECLNIVEQYFGKDAVESVTAHKMLGDISLKTNRPADAAKHYRRAFNNGTAFIYDNLLTLTSEQRADFWAANYAFYRQYLPWLCHSFENSEEMGPLLYDAMLFSNGMLLNVDKALIRTIQDSDEPTRALYAELNGKKELLMRMSQQGHAAPDLEADVRKLEQDLMKRLRQADNGSARLSAATWKQVRKALPKGAAAVEFVDFALDDGSFAGMAVILLPNHKYPVIKKIYTRTAEAWDDIYENTTVGDMVWGPVGEVVGECSDIYFVPQGPLCSIALEALPTSEATLPPGVGLHRLSSTAELIYVGKKSGKAEGATLYGGLNYDTSVEELRADSERYPELRTRAFSAGDLMAARWSRKGDVEISYLEGSRTEVDSISNFIQRTLHREPVCRVWNDGTEASFKALSGDYGKVLHVSTHGFFNDEEVPVGQGLTVEDLALQNSGLLMAGAVNRYKGFDFPDGVDDGILTAGEIADLDLSGVDLAVLSACETGLGRVTGDGVFGLQRGFKKAGARSLLMSLWKVDDDATCHLMTEFYRHWLGDPAAGIAPASKQAALEAAKASVRKNPDWNHPHYWAAFILLDALD